MTFEQLRQVIFQHYTNKDYPSALDLLVRHGGDYPENAATMLYWRACVESLLEQPEAAIASLQEMIRRELWVDAELARADADLANLAGRPEVEAQLADFARLQEEAQRRAAPRMLVLRPDAAARSPYPLLIAMHGRNDNARNFAEIWRPLAESGWVVALPQSSQILASNSFGWDDQAKAEQELADHFERLNNDFPLDDGRILLAGFSQGGGLSIWMTLNQRIPATGFLALAPYLHGLEDLETPGIVPLVRPRGFLATGDLDREAAMFDEFEARLKTAGVDYQRRRLPGIAHEIPPNFPQLLNEALEYLYA